MRLFCQSSEQQYNGLYKYIYRAYSVPFLGLKITSPYSTVCTISIFARIQKQPRRTRTNIRANTS